MTTEFIKKHQILPENIKEIFENTIDSKERDVLIASLRNVGWTLESIASASGITRERVRQIAKMFDSDDLPSVSVEIPSPPVKPIRPKPVYIEPTPQTLERLLELQPLAQLVRSNGVKYREEAEEYTALLNYAHTVEGVTLYRLAKRLGVTHGALRFRLVRYGYKTAKTASSKVYTPILQKNRIAK
jgi:hypothetical protein